MARSAPVRAAVGAAATLAALGSGAGFLSGPGAPQYPALGSGAAGHSSSMAAAPAAGTRAAGPGLGASAHYLQIAGFAGALVAAVAGRALKRRATALKVTTRSQWYRKVKRIGGDQAIFDVTIPKPLGLRLQEFPQKKRAGVGVVVVAEGGNADKLNRKVCVDDDEEGLGMWVLEGDRIMAVNGVDTEDADLDEVMGLCRDSQGPEVTLTLMRNTRKGPIKVVLMPQGFAMTVRRGCRLSSAAEAAAGKELNYGCIDGWCGTCWHRERTTNGIFKPCCDVLTADWDNVMPLVITPKPERAGDSTLLNPRGV